jgi:UDP-3-O-[3-hydroxymyristoyl] glucosamine N-acyltransferase
VATIQQGKEGDLCYCSFDGEEAVSLISKSSAGIILCKTNLEAFIDGCSSMTDPKLLHPSQQLIFVDNPRAAFIKIINKIYNKDKKNVGAGSSKRNLRCESTSENNICFCVHSRHAIGICRKAKQTGRSTEQTIW